MALTKIQMANKIKAMWKFGGSCPIGEEYRWLYGPRGHARKFCIYHSHNCKVCESVMGVVREQVPQWEVEQYGEKCYCPCNFYGCCNDYEERKQLIKERLALLGIQLED